MDSAFPQWLRSSDVALLFLRLLVAAVFFESGRRHASDPVGRAASIGLSPRFTRILGLGEMAAAIGVALGIITQVSAVVLMGVMLGAIQKKVFVWHIGFWGEDGQNGAWHCCAPGREGAHGTFSQPGRFHTLNPATIPGSCIPAVLHTRVSPEGRPHQHDPVRDSLTRGSSSRHATRRPHSQ
jgi:putative oxidoreductase